MQFAILGPLYDTFVCNYLSQIGLNNSYLAINLTYCLLNIEIFHIRSAYVAGEEGDRFWCR
jgi:hypothetical protein